MPDIAENWFSSRWIISRFADGPGNRRLPQRMAPWYRDETASAFAIARWEDDGGRVDGGGHSGSRHPLLTDGRMVPHGNRNV
jgi:hypothetical protein